MNMHVPGNLPMLKDFHERCAKAQVSYAISWNEHDDTYYVSINSAAPTERYVSKDYTNVADCIDGAIAHLKKIAPP